MLDFKNVCSLHPNLAKKSFRKWQKVHFELLTHLVHFDVLSHILLSTEDSNFNGIHPMDTAIVTDTVDVTINSGYLYV